MKKFFIIFLILILGGFSALAVARAGWYPVAIVSPSGGDSEIIWAKTLNKAQRAVVSYYRKLGAQITPSLEKEIKRALLDKIIENMLISKKLGQAAALEQSVVIQKTIANLSQNPQIGAGAAELYGLGLEDFYQLMVVPQAERELLEKKLAEDNQKLDAWLAQEKQTASIIFLVK